MQMELREHLERVKEKFTELRGLVDMERMCAEIAQRETRMSDANFWQDQEAANKIIQELKSLRRRIEPFQKMEADLKNVGELLELAEPEDSDIHGQLSEEIMTMDALLNKLEIGLLLSGREDRANAFLSIHAGAGGTESCDWASMLLRMYTRWAQSNDAVAETVDFLPGEEAGVKSVALLIKGDFIYGRLKGETGVHRLVRISPFDANKRRHTSFVSVEVTPEIDEDITIEVREEDLRVDVYRSSGAGGQHVNKTDSAVRLTHVPTGIVVACQIERSQIKNRAMAMKMLKSKLYELELQKRQAEIDKLNAQKKKIEWGSQIRSYVMQPYSLVKDHRTEVETGNVGAVMDGRLDEFIDGYLRWQARESKTTA
ncbi:MAG: peptide chain release factor 2 [Candidatus Omnitrophica bacterium]|nr:peptide chain release factor 2 [Candidatus Omnitrophota bacterium]